jgi:hypothetical protein
MIFQSGHQNWYEYLSTTLGELFEGHPVIEEMGRSRIKSGYELWWSLVGRYSECHLTRGDNILITISGIAKIIARVVNDKHISGLWGSTLLNDLL